MTPRANYKTQSPELLKKYGEFNNLVKEGAIEEKSFRTTSINEDSPNYQ